MAKRVSVPRGRVSVTERARRVSVTAKPGRGVSVTGTGGQSGGGGGVAEAFPEPSAEAIWRYNLTALEEILSEKVEGGDGAKGSIEDTVARQDPAKVGEQIRSLTHIPVLKSVSRSFQMASRSTDASLEELGAMVCQDPGLHTKILRMVNSAFFRFEREVTDVQHAMVLLGLDRIRFLAQTLGAVKELNGFSAGFDLRHLWSHSFSCGLIAEELVRNLGLTELDHAYSAGLLHDVGKIILSSLYPEIYRSLLRSSYDADFDLSAAEVRIFGHDHELAGRLFAESQKLPQAIIEAMSHHGHPASAPAGERDTVCLLYLANDFAKSFHLGFSGNPLRASEEEMIQVLGALSTPPPGIFQGGEQSRLTLYRVRQRIAERIPGIRRQVDDLLQLTFGRSAPDSMLTA